MLRPLLTFCAFCILTFCFGQTVINSEILPKIGDTLLMASDNLPEGIAIVGNGEDQFWDFTGLQSAYTKKIEITKVEGQEAELFSSSDFHYESLDGINGFYTIKNNALYLVGAKGPAPFDLGFGAIIQTNDYPRLMHFPLKFGDRHTASGNFSFKAAAYDLPIQLLYNLTVTPDSARIRCEVTREDHVDAAGVLALPDNSYETLREKRKETWKVYFDIKTRTGNWKDITDQIPDDIIPRESSIISYHYFSNESVLPVAVAQVKEDGINASQITYTVVDPSTTSRSANTGKADIFAYPNPAINDVRFEFSNLPLSNYSLKLYNILGVVVMQEDYKLSGFKTIKLDVSKLRKGTYLYGLTDEKGKTIATRRLMIIRP